MFNHTLGAKEILPLQCDILSDVTVLPMIGDITGPTEVYALGAFQNGKALPHVHRINFHTVVSQQLPPIEAWNVSSQEVIYGGIYFMHWGHFLIENLQRLWYAQQKQLPIVWAGVNGASFTSAQRPAWQKEILHALGIQNEHIFLQEPTRFAKVHFPEPGFTLGGHLHPDHVRFLEFHEEKTIAGKYVYFSRSNIRGCANEEQVEDILKKRGWLIVHPEKMSVQEQVKHICSAEILFMISGSAQHSLMYAKNLRTRIIVLPRIHDCTYNLIANAKSNNYFLLRLERHILSTDDQDAANDSFTIDIHMLQDILHETKDFTKNVESYSNILIKQEQMQEEHSAVPACSYALPAPLSDAKTYFYEAVFLYRKKHYHAAYTLFKKLCEKKLLEAHMYNDCFIGIQRYHIEQNTGITLPIEELRHRTSLLQAKIDEKSDIARMSEKLTNIFLIMGDFHNAIKTQEHLRELHPHWSKPLSVLAYIYHVQGSIDKAVEYAQKAVMLEPHRLKRKEELAHYLIRQHEYDACKKLMTEAIKDAPTWEVAYIYLADIHLAQGAIHKALACAQKAVDLAPNNLNALEKLAHCLQQNGDTQAATQLMAKRLMKNTRRGEHYAQCARIYSIMGLLDKAIEHAQKAVEEEPRNFVCKEHLATYLRMNENYDACIRIMTEAMHENPFWSEPHAQFAAIHDAKGELDKAIDCARKAVAVEPFNMSRKAALAKYRTKKLQKYFSHDDLTNVLSHMNTSTCARIQSYIDMFYAKTYLEIGVFFGDTFLNLDVPYKVAVDPEFQFEISRFTNANTVFYEDTSDAFFEKFKKDALRLQHIYHNSPFKFDVIFIDGLHTFEQTLRDFENTLPYSHEKTVWIFDDTVPSNCFSAVASLEKSVQWKACADMKKSAAWHGDVFKAIFAIHDMYPEFSYCTQVNNGNPQTILWRTNDPTPRAKVFESTKPIAHMCYEDFLEYAWVLHPVNDHEVLSKIFTNIDPLTHRTGNEYARVITPIVTDKMYTMFTDHKNNAHALTTLLKEYESLTQELKAINASMEDMLESHNALTAENAVLKKKIATLQQDDNTV